jgi:hypothetical protein
MWPFRISFKIVLLICFLTLLKLTQLVILKLYKEAKEDFEKGHTIN